MALVGATHARAPWEPAVAGRRRPGSARWIVNVVVAGAETVYLSVVPVAVFAMLGPDGSGRK
jgi:hypothetical protein